MSIHHVPSVMLLGIRLNMWYDWNLEKPYSLDRDALPQTGRIDPWLELRETVLGVRENKESNVYQISLIYQDTRCSKGTAAILYPYLHTGVQG